MNNHTIVFNRRFLLIFLFNRSIATVYWIVIVSEALKLIPRDKYETEASGGINGDTIRAYAETGVDYISSGALTHSYQSLDLSLKAEFE